MRYLLLWLMGSLSIALAGCADVYYSPEVQSKISDHEIIAVVPPIISVSACKNVKAGALNDQQRTEAIHLQEEMYSWLLKRRMANDLQVEVLDPETVNARLIDAGYRGSHELTPQEMTEVLGVDAVISSNFRMEKPMSEGAAIAVGVLTSIWGSINNVSAKISIHDADDGKELWNFSHEVSGSAFSTPEELVNQLMRKASRKMPFMD